MWYNSIENKNGKNSLFWKVSARISREMLFLFAVKFPVKCWNISIFLFLIRRRIKGRKF